MTMSTPGSREVTTPFGVPTRSLLEAVDNVEQASHTRKARVFIEDSWSPQKKFASLPLVGDTAGPSLVSMRMQRDIPLLTRSNSSSCSTNSESWMAQAHKTDNPGGSFVCDSKSKLDKKISLKSNACLKSQTHYSSQVDANLHSHTQDSLKMKEVSRFSSYKHSRNTSSLIDSRSLREDSQGTSVVSSPRGSSTLAASMSSSPTNHSHDSVTNKSMVPNNDIRNSEERKSREVRQGKRLGRSGAKLHPAAAPSDHVSASPLTSSPAPLKGGDVTSTTPVSRSTSEVGFFRNANDAGRILARSFLSRTNLLVDSPLSLNIFKGGNEDTNGTYRDSRRHREEALSPSLLSEDEDVAFLSGAGSEKIESGYEASFTSPNSKGGEKNANRSREGTEYVKGESQSNEKVEASAQKNREYKPGDIVIATVYFGKKAASAGKSSNEKQMTTGIQYANLKERCAESIIKVQNSTQEKWYRGFRRLPNIFQGKKNTRDRYFEDDVDAVPPCEEKELEAIRASLLADPEDDQDALDSRKEGELFSRLVTRQHMQFTVRCLKFQRLFCFSCGNVKCIRKSALHKDEACSALCEYCGKRGAAHAGVGCNSQHRSYLSSIYRSYHKEMDSRSSLNYRVDTNGLICVTCGGSGHLICGFAPVPAGENSLDARKLSSASRFPVHKAGSAPHYKEAIAPVQASAAFMGPPVNAVPLPPNYHWGIGGRMMPQSMQSPYNPSAVSYWSKVGHSDSSRYGGRSRQHPFPTIPFYPPQFRGSQRASQRDNQRRGYRLERADQAIQLAS